MYEKCDSPGQAEGYYKRGKWTPDEDIQHHFYGLANIQNDGCLMCLLTSNIRSPLVTSSLSI